MNRIDISQRLILIAALDEAGGIGRQGSIPWDLPQDRAFFKAKTLGFPTLMGRKTFESLGCRALPQRPAAVWSRSLAPSQSLTLLIHHDLDTLLAWCFAQSNIIFGIGGAQVYTKLLPLTSEMWLSRVPGNWDCDAYFPSFSGFTLENRQNMPSFTIEHWIR